MCLPLFHTWGDWQPKKETEIQTIKNEYPLVFDIHFIRITQDKVCRKCNLVKTRVIDTYQKSKIYHGSFRSV